MTDGTSSPRVVAVGPAPSGPRSRGGMATVMTLTAAAPTSVTVVPTYVDDRAVVRLVTGVSGMLRASWLVLRGRADVLHVHLAHGGSVVRKAVPLLAARVAGVPSVVHAHSFDFAGWLDGLPRPVLAVVRRTLVADRWLVLAREHVEAFSSRLRMDPASFRVLHNPVDLSVLLPARRSPGRLTVVSLGRLGTRKGSYDVVAAVAALTPAERERLHVVLAGDGEVDEVRAAAAAAGVADRVDVRGWQTPEECRVLLAGADAFVLPSHEEGLPMALLEAMGAGLAPVVSPVGGIPDVVVDDEDGLLVPPGDPAALAVALARLIVDDDLVHRLGAAARAVAEQHDVAAWHAQLMDLWRELAR